MARKPFRGVLFLPAVAARARCGRRHCSTSPATATEDDFRKLEPAGLNPASTPDLPVARTILSDDCMGSSFRTPDSCGSDVVHPAGVPANRFPMSALADSTVRIFGDTAVLMGKVEMQGEQKSEIIPMTIVFPKQARTGKSRLSTSRKLKLNRLCGLFSGRRPTPAIPRYLAPVSAVRVSAQSSGKILALRLCWAGGRTRPSVHEPRIS